MSIRRKADFGDPSHPSFGGGPRRVNGFTCPGRIRLNGRLAAPMMAGVGEPTSAQEDEMSPSNKVRSLDPKAPWPPNPSPEPPPQPTPNPPDPSPECL